MKKVVLKVLIIVILLTLLSILKTKAVGAVCYSGSCGGTAPACGSCACCEYWKTSGCGTSTCTNPQGQSVSCYCTNNYAICGWTACDVDALGNDIWGMGWFCGCESQPPAAPTNTPIPPTPTPTKIPCNGNCTQNSQCASGYCLTEGGVNKCRSSACKGDEDCDCNSSCDERCGVPGWWGTCVEGTCTYPPGLAFTVCVCEGLPTPTPIPDCCCHCTGGYRIGNSLVCVGVEGCHCDPDSYCIPTLTPTNTPTPTSSPTPILCPVWINDLKIGLNYYDVQCVSSCSSPNIPASAWDCTSGVCCLVLIDEDIPTPIPTNTPSSLIPYCGSCIAGLPIVQCQSPYECNGCPGGGAKCSINNGCTDCLTPTPNPTLPPTNSLCCRADTCTIEMINCSCSCPPAASAGSSCDCGVPQICPPGSCGGLYPSSFLVGAGGEPVSLMMSGTPYSPSSPADYGFRWYSSPIGGTSVLDANSLATDTKYSVTASVNWCWSFFQTFTAQNTGYLDKVEVFIGVSTGTNYFSVMVTDSAGNRLTDNDSCIGGADRTYVNSTTGKWVTWTFDIRPRLTAGQSYRLYVQPQPGPNSIPSFWKGKNNVKAHKVWLTTSTSALAQPIFNNFSHDGVYGGADIRMPVTAILGTSYKIVGEVSGPASLQAADNCYVYGSGQCTGTATVTYPPSDAWFQTKDINVYSRGNLVSKVATTANPAYFALVGTGTFPGTVVYKGPDNANFNGNPVSAKGWLAKTESKNIKMTYEYLYNSLKVDPIACTPTHTSINPKTDDGIVCYSGSQTITSGNWGKINQNQFVVVFIDGNLTFSKDIEVDEGGFLAFIVSGDIIFESNVTNAQGLFLADGTITVQSAGSGDEQFLGEGSFIGWEGITLSRDLGDNNRTTPGEVFSSRPDLWINAPKEFKLSLLSREELMP